METLRDLMDKGIVWVENSYYVGLASDGEIVQLGHDEQDTIVYLTDHPTPDTW